MGAEKLHSATEIKGFATAFVNSVADVANSCLHAGTDLSAASPASSQLPIPELIRLIAREMFQRAALYAMEIGDKPLGHINGQGVLPFFSDEINGNSPILASPVSHLGEAVPGTLITPMYVNGDSSGLSRLRQAVRDAAAHGKEDAPNRAVPSLVQRPDMFLGAAYERLLSMSANISPECGSLVFQPVRRGARRTRGSYYTPPDIVDRLLSSTLDPVLDACADNVDQMLAIRICDPSCGAGGFLVPAAKRIAARIAAVCGKGTDAPGHPMGTVASRCIHGIDSDPQAAELTVLALLIATKLDSGIEARSTDRLWRELARNAVCDDSLLGTVANRWGGTFDVIVGNPPWSSFSGRHRKTAGEADEKAIRERYLPGAPWCSTHGAFMVLGMELLKPGGHLGMVLPAQVSHLSAYESMRRSITEQCDGPVIVHDIGDAFPGVHQPVGLYSLRKVGRRRGDKTHVPTKRGPLPNEAGRAVGTGDGLGAAWLPVSELGTGDRSATGNGMDLRLAVLGKYPTFPAVSFFDPGVHTGNASSKLIVELNGGDRDCVPVRVGRDVRPYCAAVPSRGLLIGLAPEEGEYWRIGAIERYHGVPILIRQTSAYPIAARHEAPTYFRNSLLACMGVPGVSDEVIVAVLNSAMMRAWYQSQFADGRQQTFPQVKVTALRKLPMFDPSRLESLVGGMTIGKSILDLVHEAELAEIGGLNSLHAIQPRINRLVEALYGIET